MDTVIFKLLSNISVLSSTGFVIPFLVDNTDYQLFKAQIEAGTAELEDEEGILLTPEQAKAYVATLP
jgi:hypothetical protein